MKSKIEKNLLNQAVDNMRGSGETTLVHQGKTYKLEEHTHHVRKNDRKKREDTVSILNDEGFHGEEAEDMYEKILGAYRGPESVSYQLK